MNDNMNDNVDKAEGINNYLGNVEKIEVEVPNKIHGYFLLGKEIIIQIRIIESEKKME